MTKSTSQLKPTEEYSKEELLESVKKYNRLMKHETYLKTIHQTKFNEIKKHHHETLLEAIRIGRADKPIMKLCHMVDRKKHYFTSSSCSGRILLLQLDENETKRPDGFFAKWHRTVTFKEFKEALAKPIDGNFLWFKQEGLILHIGCDTIESAEKLLLVCRQAGLKRFGIQSVTPGKIMVEMIGTQNMHFLVKIKDQILCDDFFLKTQLKKANEKFRENNKLIKTLERLLKKLE